MVIGQPFRLVYGSNLAQEVTQVFCYRIPGVVSQVQFAFYCPLYPGLYVIEWTTERLNLAQTEEEHDPCTEQVDLDTVRLTRTHFWRGEARRPNTAGHLDMVADLRGIPKVRDHSAVLAPHIDVFSLDVTVHYISGVDV